MIHINNKNLTKVFVGVFVAFQGFSSLQAQQILSLEQSKELALQNNNRIAKAKEDITTAESGKIVAGLAGKAKIDASATAFYFGKPINTMLPEYGIAPMVSISQPLYTGGKVKYGLELAETDIELGKAQQKFVENEVLLAVEMAYWQVVLAKEQIELELQVKKQLASNFELMNNQFKAGLTYKNDVLRAKVLQNENESRLQMFENQLALSKKRLSQLIGNSDASTLDIVDTLEKDFTTDLEFQNTENDRPEIDLASGMIKKAEIAKNILKADFKPTVGLALNGVAAFGKKGINFNDPTKNQMFSYFGMLSVNIPVFDWGVRKEKVRQQDSVIKSAELGMKELKSQIEVEVEQATLELGLQAKKIQLMEASLREADENLKLSNDRFSVGTNTGEDVLIAQTLWQKTYSDMLEAKIRYKMTEAVYKKTIGNIK